MLEQLKQLALEALERDPTLRREIVPLVAAIDVRTGAPRTFPTRQERRAARCGPEATGERLTRR